MIIRSKKRGFEITRGNFALGELNMPKWYSLSGSTKIPSGDLEVKSKGPLSNTYVYWLGGKERGRLTSDWKGCMGILVDWELNGVDTVYKFSTRGFWNRCYEVIAEDEQLLFSLKPCWSWSTWSYDYEVEQHGQIEDTMALELLLYAGHAARVKAAQQSAAVG